MPVCVCACVCVCVRVCVCVCVCVHVCMCVCWPYKVSLVLHVLLGVHEHSSRSVRLLQFVVDEDERFQRFSGRALVKLFLLSVGHNMNDPGITD